MLRIFSKCLFSTQNFYQILGVKRNATTEEIKKQFHSLAKQYHPDSPNSKESDQEMFKTIVAAYNTLSDDNERKKYDRILIDQQQQDPRSQSQQQYQQQQQSQSQQRTQRPINPNAKFYYDFRKKTQNFDENDFQRMRSSQTNGFIEDNPLFHSMRKSPELYVVSLVLFVIMWRWYSQMVEERTQQRYQSYPEDPEFIKERERDYMKRHGRSPYPDRQILYKVTQTECKNIPIDILDQMETSGRYSLAQVCYERLDKYRSEEGAQVIQASRGEEDSVQEYLKLSKNYKNKKQFVDEDDEDEDDDIIAQQYHKANAFRKVKGLNTNHLNQENVKHLQK